MKEIWQQALGDLRDQIPVALYQSLLTDASLREIGAPRDRGALQLRLDFPQIAPQMRGPWTSAVEARLSRLTGRDVQLSFAADSLATPALASVDWINPRWTLERFACGPENQIACAAVEATAQAPGATTPLYLAGDSGAGKTHLAHAFAHLCLSHRPMLQIGYAALSDFRDELQQALRRQSMLEFKSRWRSFDCLILEDLQMLRDDAETVQEELFHVLDHFIERRKQLVLTADRGARDLNVPARFQSRLLAGLQAQLRPAGPELRERIVLQRCAEEKVDLPASASAYLARQVLGGVRELEAALAKVFLLARAGIPVDQPARLGEHLRELAPRPDSSYFSMDQIVDAVARRFRVSREQILGMSRRAEFTLPRHVAMYLGLKHSSLNKSAIARYFRKSDHTTVINAERNIHRRLQKESGFQRQLAELLEDLRKEGG